MNLVGNAALNNQRHLVASFVIDKVGKTVEVSGASQHETFKLSGSYNIIDHNRIVLNANASFSYLDEGKPKPYYTGQIKLEMKTVHSGSNQYEIVLIHDSKNGVDPDDILSCKIGHSNNEIELILSGTVRGYSMNGRIKTNKEKLYSMQGNVEARTRGKRVFNLGVNTKTYPYSIEISPASGAGITINRQKSESDLWFLEADYEPDQYLHINSNSADFTAFNVDKMKTNLVRFELNGKELCQSSLGPSSSDTVHNQFSLPSGYQGHTSLTWKGNDMRNNEAAFQLDIGKTLNGLVKWDIRDPLRKILLHGNMNLS